MLFSYLVILIVSDTVGLLNKPEFSSGPRGGLAAVYHVVRDVKSSVCARM